MSSKAITFWVIVIAVVGIYFWVSNDESQESTKNEISQAESKRDQILRVFTEKYKPNTQIDSANLKYSFQFEDALITPGKPIVFTGNLDDISRKDGEFYMTFTPEFFNYSDPNIFYSLKGCGDKIDKILENKGSPWDSYYAVVAKITSIEKPRLRVSGNVYDVEDVELELSEPLTFIASGECLDLEYFEDI